MSNLSSLSYYIPELIIISAILLVIVLDVIPACKKYTFSLSLGAILLASVFLWQSYGESHGLFMGMISIDPFSHFFKMIFTVIRVSGRPVLLRKIFPRFLSFFDKVGRSNFR